MVAGEPDFQKRMKALTDLWYIKGLLLKDPTIALTVPVSIENPAIAYDLGNDRFKVDIQAITAVTLDMNLAQVLGVALDHSNPVISRLTDGSNFIDPRDRNWTISESLARSWNLGGSDVPDLSDRAARLLGKIYGDQGVLTQRATSLDLLVQLRHNAAEIDPRAIRALTATDIVTVVQATAASLKATVTQAEKDRTISSVDATATALQINLAALNGNSAALYTPAGGKAVRIKFISLEHSADVDLGYRFAAAGSIWYLRTTKGAYVSNLVGCNNQGAADAALYLNSSAATNVKGYILLSEV
jgi:hypothetical protein